ETLGQRYVVTPPALPQLPTGKVQVVRIIATQAETSLTFDPPQSLPPMIANPGEFLEIDGTADSFEVSADHPIIVAQYMEGRWALPQCTTMPMPPPPECQGDPAMALAVPVEQFRFDYLFHAPLSYQSNFVNVVAPVGAQVMLDDQPVAGFTAIGGTGMQVALLP